MSLDFYLFPSDGKPLDAAGFAALFAKRVWYKTDGEQAVYENRDTGVYFTFDHVVPTAEDLADEDAPDDPRFARPHIGLTLNLSRPDFFGLECAIELEALVKARAFTIYDPQDEADGPAYSTDRFLVSWRKSNLFGNGLLTGRKPPPARLPMDVNRRVWEWNYRRQVLQESLEVDLFVPKIMLFAGPAVRRTFVWTLDVPTVIPPAAEWALLLDNPAARCSPGKPDMLGFVPLSVLERFARPVAGSEGLRCLPAASREAIPGPLRQAELPASGSLLEPDSVYDAETLAAVKA